MFARIQRGNRWSGVQVIRGANADCINFRHRNQLMVVGEKMFNLVFLGEMPRPLFIYVAHCDDGNPFHVSVTRQMFPFRDCASANNANCNFFHGISLLL
jgi:hypothetical protein